MRMGVKTGAEVMEKGMAEEAPAEVETVTLKEPRVALAAITNVAVICVALTTTTLLTVMSGLEVARVAPATNLEPASVTEKFEPAKPLEGLIEAREGGARTTVKGTAEDVPPELETVTLAAPREALGAMVKVAVI